DTRSRVSFSLSNLNRKSDTRSRVSLSLSDLALKQDAIPGFSHSLSDLAIKKENTSVLCPLSLLLKYFPVQCVLNETLHEVIRLKHLKLLRPVYQSYLLSIILKTRKVYFQILHRQ